MNKFKVGDRVRCIDDYVSDYIQKGGEYIIEHLHNEFVGILGDKVTDTSMGASGGWYASHFELIKSNFRVGDKVIVKSTGEVVKYLGILTGEDKNLSLISRKQLI